MDKNRIRSLSVGVDEHRRIKILSAREDASMTDLVNRLINQEWERAHKLERNTQHASKDKEKQV